MRYGSTFCSRCGSWISVIHTVRGSDVGPCCYDNPEPAPLPATPINRDREWTLIGQILRAIDPWTAPGGPWPLLNSPSRKFISMATTWSCNPARDPIPLDEHLHRVLPSLDAPLAKALVDGVPMADLPRGALPLDGPPPPSPMDGPHPLDSLDRRSA